MRTKEGCCMKPCAGMACGLRFRIAAWGPRVVSVYVYSQCGITKYLTDYDYIFSVVWLRVGLFLVNWKSTSTAKQLLFDLEWSDGWHHVLYLTLPYITLHHVHKLMQTFHPPHHASISSQGIIDQVPKSHHIAKSTAYSREQIRSLTSMEFII